MTDNPKAEDAAMSVCEEMNNWSLRKMGSNPVPECLHCIALAKLDVAEEKAVWHRMLVELRQALNESAGGQCGYWEVEEFEEVLDRLDRDAGR